MDIFLLTFSPLVIMESFIHMEGILVLEIKPNFLKQKKQALNQSCSPVSNQRNENNHMPGEKDNFKPHQEAPQVNLAYTIDDPPSGAPQKNRGSTLSHATVARNVITYHRSVTSSI